MPSARSHLIVNHEDHHETESPCTKPRRGRRILALNGTPIKDVEQLRALVSKAGRKVALLVLRDDARIFVPVELG